VGLLRRLHQTQGLTLVLVEQNLEFIAELATRVLLIQKGAILRELQPGELRQADVLSEFVGVDRT
jgi:urea transport system ATP-binding protein